MVLCFLSLLVKTACIGKPNGDIPHPFKCARYITCFKERAYEMDCPDGLHFNPAELLCVLSNDYPCPLHKR